jgi:hypothetical protein
LENVLRTERSEEPVAPALEKLHIDHMLPQKWPEYWPLQDGSSVTSDELTQAKTASWFDEKNLTDRQKVILAREAAVPTMGNLTLLHYGTNTAAQHRELAVKRELFLQHSNLHLNRDMLVASRWDEDSIQKRAETFCKHMLQIWPGL